MQANSLGTHNNQVIAPTVFHANSIILFNGTHGQSANYNLIDNPIGYYYTSAVAFTYNGYVAGGGDGFNHNVFRDFGLQSEPGSAYGFKNIQNVGNIFLDDMVWDAKSTGNVTATVNSTATNTLIVGYGLTSHGFVDNGINTTVPSLAGNQSQTLTATLSASLPPYTYNYTVYKPNGLLVANALYSGVASTSNTFTYHHLISWGGGNFTANLTVTDSAATPTPSTKSISYSANSYYISFSPPVIPSPPPGPSPPPAPNTGGVILPYDTTTSVTSTVGSTIPTTIPISDQTSEFALNLSTSPLVVAIPRTPMRIIIRSNTTAPARLNTVNLTSSALGLTGYTLITAMNISLITSANVSIVANVTYPCSINAQSLAAFILKGGVWKEIGSNYSFTTAKSCTLSFAVPKDPIIALFAKATSTNTSSSTVPSTSIMPTTSNPQIRGYIAPATVSAAIAAVIMYLLAKRYLRTKKGPNRV